MNIAIIVLIICSAIVTVIQNLAPVINTFVTKASEEKRLWYQNHFAAKERAYVAFANAVAECRENPTREAVDKLYSACVCAGFFSSEKTGETLAALAAAMLKKERDNKLLGKLQIEAIDLMRAELNEPTEIKRRKHSKNHGKKTA